MASRAHRIGSHGLRQAAVAALLLVAVDPPNGKGAPPLWGGLQPGPYPVGHRSSFSIDHGRVDLVAPNRERNSSSQLFRPVLLAIWYPASKVIRRPMEYREYFNIPNLPSFPEFSWKLAQFGRNAASQAMLRKRYHSPSRDSRDSVDQVLATTVYAYKNLPPAAGPFPVVIYHAGAAGSFEDNSVLFEFLASHGYVVISSAYQMGTDHVANDIGGAVRSINDMQFLLNEAGRSSFVDVTRSAAIGHSAGGQFLLQWIGEPECPLRSVVTLDTTLEYTPEDFAGHQELRRTLAAMEPPVIPVLLFASTERNPNFSTLDRYLYRTERHEVSIRGLRHDDYLTHGLMRTFVPGLATIAEADRASIRKGYEHMCKTVLRFLSAYLKSDQRAIVALNQAATIDDPGQIITIRHKRRR